MVITLDDLRRFAVSRSLFKPVSLKRALDTLGFVQADPIRAPARAQDLTLRPRVSGYRAGDLERRYSQLGVAEDFFLNYGFVTHALQALMHPRPGSDIPYSGNRPWPASRKKQARLLLDFIGERGSAHPREVDAHFSHGTVENYWGGSSNATTHLLDAMHYRGMLRVSRRESGIRIYAIHQHGAPPAGAAERRVRVDALVDAAVGIYAPVPAASLGYLVRRLRLAAPQWHGELKDALRRAKERLSHARVEGVDWFWPAAEDPMRQSRARSRSGDRVYLLTPFDPVVWDRHRFELFWGWAYRFEAYTPVARRKLGYYALPMLWRDRVIGWGNLTLSNGRLESQFGYVASAPPADTIFETELEAEACRMRVFLGLA